jgi:hypothetical protein
MIMYKKLTNGVDICLGCSHCDYITKFEKKNDPNQLYTYPLFGDLALFITSKVVCQFFLTVHS